MSDDFITRDEAELIADAAAERGSQKAIKATFALLGVDIDSFDAVQDFRGDLQWIRSGRRVSRAISSKAGSSALGVITIAVLIALGDWVRAAFTNVFHQIGH